MSCKDLKNWGDLDKDQRADQMMDMLARMAEDYDVPIPSMVLGPAPDNPETTVNESDLPAAYDPETNTVYFNRLSEWTYKDDPSELLNSAGHEFGHELFDQAHRDDYDLTTPEGREAYDKDSEDYADAYENQLADEIKDECDPHPPQSPGEPDIDADEGGDEGGEDEGDDPHPGRPKPSRPGDWEMPPPDEAPA